MKSKVVTDVLALTTANTQYAYTFPQNTRGFRFKVRATDKILRYSTVTGKVAAASEPYSTLPAGGVLNVDGLKLGQTTMYFSADSNSQVLEITYWTGIDRAS